LKYTNKQLNDIKRDVHMPSILMDRMKVTQVGDEFDALCPFHEDKTTGNFKMYFKDDWWQAHCFSCGKTWNIFQVIAQTDNLSFGAAIEKVVSLAEWEEGKTMVDKTFSAVGGEKKYNTYPFEVMKPAREALRESTQAQQWLEKRGITLETAESMNLGFIQSAEAVSQDHPWVNGGWIVIPTITNGVITCLKYRSLVGKKEEIDGKTVSGILRGPKMQTSLYNLQNVSCMEDVYVVEGEPDVWAMHQAGYNAVGYPSAEYTPTAEERKILVSANRIILAGDNDEAGLKMRKLQAEIRDRVFVMEWPTGVKDANDALLNQCFGDTDTLRVLVARLTDKALETPIPHYFDLVQTLKRMGCTPPSDNPDRLHFRSSEVDAMAINTPGDIVSVYATFTGSGKSTFCIDQIVLEELLNHNSGIIYYSAELSQQEVGILVASNLTQTDRLQPTDESNKRAAKMLERADAKFYVGYNPDLNRVGMVLDSLEAAIKHLGARIIILDHLHFLCRGESDTTKAQENAMQRMKNMARKFGVIFVVVGQSRKEPQGAKSRANSIGDAKGSESFTSDASAVYHLHRNMKRDVNMENPEGRPKDILELITDVRLLKCRTKGPGDAVCRLNFVGRYAMFTPYVPFKPDEPAVEGAAL